MVKLIPGKKGSGKTKLLINEIHAAEKQSKGNVVAIQLGSSLNVDIYHKIRLVNIEDYKVTNCDALFGFIAGILASDYDCTDIFIDGTLRITGRNLEDAGKMFDRIAEISGDTNVTFTVSEDPAAMSDAMKKYL